MTQMNLPTKQKRLTDTESRLTAAQGREEGGVDWESGVGGCKLSHLQYRKDEVLLYSTGNYIQCSVINHNGKEFF